MSRRQVVRLALLSGAALVSVLWIVGLVSGGNESEGGERGLIGTRLEGAKERYRAAGDAARRVWNNEGIFSSGLGTGLGTGTRGGEGAEEVWVNLEEELPTTRFEGGECGVSFEFGVVSVTSESFGRGALARRHGPGSCHAFFLHNFDCADVTGPRLPS